MTGPADVDGAPRSGHFKAMDPLRLDLTGLKCPLPVLRARKALRTLDGGALLDVICTDPMAAIDIPHMVRENGDALIAQTAEAGVLSFRIQKATS